METSKGYYALQRQLAGGAVVAIAIRYLVPAYEVLQLSMT
jgi:hypothetical protein